MDADTYKENLERVQRHLQYSVAQCDRLRRYLRARQAVDDADDTPAPPEIPDDVMAEVIAARAALWPDDL